LTAKHHPIPTVAMSTPATAGPMTLEVVITALLRLTALATSAGPTISTTSARRAGLSMAVASPSTAART
jgi:hypothetical protein